MNGIEKRKYIRVPSTNLLNYVCMSNSDEPCQQGMGRTLNVSESGILLETYQALDPESRLSISIGIEDDLVDIDGTVVFTQKSAENLYETGIQFSRINDNERTILFRYIEAFKSREK